MFRYKIRAGWWIDLIGCLNAREVSRKVSYLRDRIDSGYSPKALPRTLGRLGRYETDLDEVHYSHASSADFDNDGRPEIIALDGSNHIADLLGSGRCLASSTIENLRGEHALSGRKGSKLERQILMRT